MKYFNSVIFLTFFLTATICSCNNSSTKLPIKYINKQIIEKKNTYLVSLKILDSLKLNSKKIDVKTRGELFSNSIDTKIIPHWIGTPWDFNGTTQIPNQGFIACGYFVTTVLRDAGISIKRVKMAQCASETMIRSLTSKVTNYSSFSFNKFITEVKLKGIGLSIIGLDNHTGFLYFDGNELYFIHSSFVGEGKVAKEIASKNEILQHSKYKVVGFISQDANFINHWK